MNKIKSIKKVLFILGIAFGLLTIVIGLSFINHKLQLSKEESIFVANGEIVEINEHKMHVYSEGEGDNTLVFMAGGGTSSPVLDFKSLYSILSDKYKIAVVEKSGYGFSEESNVDRDIDTMLKETREALFKAGIKAPFILYPHSISGIEALYWAQKHPEEVKGIIGLDMAVPEAYEDYKVNTRLFKIGRFGSQIGITRLFPSIVNSSAAIKYGGLKEEEKELYRTVFYRKTASKSMLREVEEIKSNAEKVKANGIPNIPILLFSSNGDGTGWDKDKWLELQSSYIKKLDIGKNIKFNCEHYIHNIEYEKIAEESIKFIEETIY